MSVVPIILSGVFYPKNKKDPPLVGTFVGNAAIAGLEVGGGPIIPPDEVPPVEPPLVIWGPPDMPPGFWGGGMGPGVKPQPHPEHPIVLPPEQPPSPPEKPHEGWNWSEAKSGWYYLYIPGEDEAQPKQPKK